MSNVKKTFLLRQRKLLFAASVAIGVFFSQAFQSAVDTDIQNAQTWFGQLYPFPKFMDIAVTPNWSAARKVIRSGGGMYIEVPLQEQIETNIGNLRDSDIDTTQNQYKNGCVKIIIEVNNNQRVAFFLNISGTKSFLDTNGKLAVLANTFDKINSNFTGTIEYFFMDSWSYKGIVLENGAPVGDVFTRLDRYNRSAHDRCLTCYTTYIPYSVTVVSPFGTGASYTTTTCCITTTQCIQTGPCTSDPIVPPGYVPGSPTSAYWTNYLQNGPNCPNGTTRPPDGVCRCGDGSYMPPNGTCQCPNGNTMPANGVCTCPDGKAAPVDGMCKCPDGSPMPSNGNCGLINCNVKQDLGYVPFGIHYLGLCRPVKGNGANCSIEGTVVIDSDRNDDRVGYSHRVVSSSASGTLMPLLPGSTNANISTLVTFVWKTERSVAGIGIASVDTVVEKVVAFLPDCCK